MRLFFSVTAVGSSMSKCHNELVATERTVAKMWRTYSHFERGIETTCKNPHHTWMNKSICGSSLHSLTDKVTEILNIEPDGSVVFPELFSDLMIIGSVMEQAAQADVLVRAFKAQVVIEDQTELSRMDGRIRSTIKANMWKESLKRLERLRDICAARIDQSYWLDDLI